VIRGFEFMIIKLLSVLINPLGVRSAAETGKPMLTPPADARHEQLTLQVVLSPRVDRLLIASLILDEA
jgi:hypothetical protein